MLEQTPEAEADIALDDSDLLWSALSVEEPKLTVRERLRPGYFVLVRNNYSWRCTNPHAGQDQAPAADCSPSCQ